MKLFRKTIRSALAATARGWVLVFGSMAFASLPATVEAATDGTTHLSGLANLPLYFEANSQPTGDAHSFVARGHGCSFFVAPTEVSLTLAKIDSPVEGSRAGRALTACSRAMQTRTLNFSFLDANPHARMNGSGKLPGKANYFLGKDPAAWRTGVSLFASVRVEGIYPGVDLIYYGNAHRLEYDFLVAPKSDPRVIALRVTGADKLHLNMQGDLVFTLGRDEIVQPKPHIYQTVAGVRKEVSGGYDFTDRQTVTFRIGDYDRELPLVIDPVLSYSTFFGGNGLDAGWDIAVDSKGFVYIAGETMSVGLATPGAFRANYSGGVVRGDAFVAKFDNQGTTLSYCTYLGGKGDDGALALVVNGDGNAFITGFTSSTDFPVASALSTNLSGVKDPTYGTYPFDGFVTELNTNGSALVFSTYLGGSTDDEGIGIALDPAGYTYVTGFTESTNFPTAAAASFPITPNMSFTNYNGNTDAFVTKIKPNGAGFEYSMYLGGTNVDNGQGIVADATGNAYVAGFTTSTNFPITANAVQKFLNNPAIGATNHVTGSNDVFITKLSSDGSALIFSTFLGGGRDDYGFRLALDAEKNVYVTGSALSLDFPTVPASNTNILKGVTTTNLLSDVFVTKLAAAGTDWVYSVVFGGTNQDEGWDVAVDSAAQAHIVGRTYSTNFPTANTSGFLRATNSGGSDAFVAVLGSAGTNLVRSAYLGGSGNDFGADLEVDVAGNDYIVGQTLSTNFPTAAPFDSTLNGGQDAFIAKILVEPVLTETAAGENVILSWPVFAPGFTLQSNTNVTTSDGWTDVTTPPVQIGVWHTVTLGATNESLFFRLRTP